MITANALNSFLLIILGILFGIVIVYIYIGESDTLPKIKKRLTVRWTPINITRNKPVILIRNFRPMDVVKKLLIDLLFF